MEQHSLFAWEGFSFLHPEDWAPVALTGNHKEGYVRVASPHRACFQVRWKSCSRPSDPGLALDRYLDRLRKDSRKARETFAETRDQVGGKLVYRWTGAGQGRGLLFYSESDGRLIFAEAFGGRKDSLKPLFQLLLDSFSVPSGDLRTWSMLGLTVHLPHQFKMSMKKLRAGQTTLGFTWRGRHLEAQRWAFARELLAKHELADWSTRVLNMPKSEVVEECGGMRLKRKAPALLKEEAIVRVDLESNQLLCLKSRSRRTCDLPWEWLC